MAFRLTKGLIEQKNELAGKLGVAQQDLDGAIEGYNAALDELKEPVIKALEAYNAILSEAREFAEDIAVDIEEQIDEKSDTWRESDKGEAAQDWLRSWQDIDLEDHDIDFPEAALDLLEIEHSDNFEQLPEEADGV